MQQISRRGPNAEAIEDGEVRRIERPNLSDAAGAPSRGEQGIEDSLPAESVEIHPIEPEQIGGKRRSEDGAGWGLDPKATLLHGFFHSER